MAKAPSIDDEIGYNPRTKKGAPVISSPQDESSSSDPQSTDPKAPNSDTAEPVIAAAGENKKSSAFAVFSIQQFRWLFFGNVAFFFAMQGQMLTRTIIAWDLTGQATSLAYVNLVVAIPMIFASLIGGAITDRVERRQLVIFGQCLIAMNEAIMLVLLLTDSLEFWHMLCTAFIAGCAFPFIMPARMAITVSVVGPKLLQSGMAFGAAVMNLSRVFGPAVRKSVV